MFFVWIMLSFLFSVKLEFSRVFQTKKNVFRFFFTFPIELFTWCDDDKVVFWTKKKTFCCSLLFYICSLSYQQKTMVTKISYVKSNSKWNNSKFIHCFVRNILQRNSGFIKLNSFFFRSYFKSLVVVVGIETTTTKTTTTTNNINENPKKMNKKNEIK